MSDNATNITADRTTDAPIRLCPRTRWACPLYTLCRTCDGLFARPAGRAERLARLVLKARATARFRGESGGEAGRAARDALEWRLQDELWHLLRVAVLDAGELNARTDAVEVTRRADADFDALLADARRAAERGDYARRSQPADPTDPDDRPPSGGGAALTADEPAATADPDDFAWSLLAGAIRQARRFDARRAA